MNIRFTEVQKMRIQATVIRIQTSLCSIIYFYRIPLDGASVDYETVHPHRHELMYTMANYTNISRIDIHW